MLIGPDNHQFFFENSDRALSTREVYLERVRCMQRLEWALKETERIPTAWRASGVGAINAWV